MPDPDILSTSIISQEEEQKENEFEFLPLKIEMIKSEIRLAPD